MSRRGHGGERTVDSQDTKRWTGERDRPEIPHRLLLTRALPTHRSRPHYRRQLPLCTTVLRDLPKTDETRATLLYCTGVVVTRAERIIRTGQDQKESTTTTRSRTCPRWAPSLALALASCRHSASPAFLARRRDDGRRRRRLYRCYWWCSSCDR